MMTKNNSQQIVGNWQMEIGVSFAAMLVNCLINEGQCIEFGPFLRAADMNMIDNNDTLITRYDPKYNNNNHFHAHYVRISFVADSSHRRQRSSTDIVVARIHFFFTFHSSELVHTNNPKHHGVHDFE